MENQEQQASGQTLFESGVEQQSTGNEVLEPQIFEEHELPQRRFPGWLMAVVAILIIIGLFWGGSFLLDKLGSFNKPGNPAKASPTPSVCPKKVNCSLVHAPADCKIIQPKNPCDCPTAFVCPKAE